MMGNIRRVGHRLRYHSWDTWDRFVNRPVPLDEQETCEFITKMLWGAQRLRVDPANDEKDAAMCALASEADGSRPRDRRGVRVLRATSRVLISHILCRRFLRQPELIATERACKATTLEYWLDLRSECLMTLAELAEELGEDDSVRRTVEAGLIALNGATECDEDSRVAP